jgi:hypothetical protein
MGPYVRFFVVYEWCKSGTVRKTAPAFALSLVAAFSTRLILRVEDSMLLELL